MPGRHRHRVLLVGGPDVDGRIDLMERLRVEFEVLAAGSADLTARFADRGFEYLRYGLSRGVRPWADLATVASLGAIFRRTRPLIVHTFDTKPSVWGRLAAHLAGVPVVVGTLPGLGSLYTPGRRPMRVARAAYEALQGLACRWSDLTIFQNGADAEQMIASGIVAREKAETIPGSGVRTDEFDRRAVPEEDVDRTRKELGLEGGVLVVTMVSRVIRSKGVMGFVKAAAIVRGRRPDVRFLLVGAPDEQSPDALSPSEISEVRESVLWPGPRTDVRAILALTEIFALPTYYREGIPRVLMEAASMGLPLVTTDSPGCREVVEDGVNGLHVPPRDPERLALAILSLAEDVDLRRRFGEASRRKAVSQFDLSRIAERIRLTYERLLEEKGLCAAGGPCDRRA